MKKKKVKEREKKETRGQGYQPVFGVASGMGAKVAFSIARSDGFEEAPGQGKVEKLKKFNRGRRGRHRLFLPSSSDSNANSSSCNWW